jgi:hypothetical protein
VLLRLGEEQIPNPKPQTPNPKKNPNPDGSAWDLGFGIWDLGFGIWDLRRALAVHDDGVERLTLAEVDEVVRRGVVCVQLDEIL